MGQGFSIEVSGPAAIVRFDRPAIKNPLSIGVLDGLSAFLDQAATADDIKSIIFTGSEDVFASGADLREIASVDESSACEFALRGQRLMASVASLPKVTVAAINGYCFGGALDLALACDRRIGSPAAQFCHPGAGLGIITGWGGTQRLPRLVGRTNALMMFFTATPIKAVEALRTGLIDEISVSPVEAAIEHADQAI